MNWIRYNRLTRRVIVLIAHKLKGGWIEEKLCDFLYPDDCIISFKEDGE